MTRHVVGPDLNLELALRRRRFREPRNDAHALHAYPPAPRRAFALRSVPDSDGMTSAHWTAEQRIVRVGDIKDPGARW